MRTIAILLLSASLLATPELWAQKNKATASARLDPSKPEDAVKIMRKLQSSLKDDEDVVYWWEGSVYSRVPGEKDRLLFTYQAMNVRRSATVTDPEKGYGYRMVSRELLFYQDPQTKEILRTWKNPWTGKEVEVIHIANDPVNSRPIFANPNSANPYKLPGTFKDDMFLATFEVPLFYTNPLAGEYQEYVGGTYQAIEIFNFACDVNDLLDANKNTAEKAIVAWNRVSKWLPWMEMGDRTGQLIFSGLGKKLKSWDDLPEVMKNEIRTNYPVYVSAPPTNDDRPNETSWTVFKKYIDAKRQKK
ncbi:MAG: DUF1838 family protein [Cytophagales bacterium]|nr:DUF1838 domain-containing protein [Bernardetiaceae bacterium]MDW8204388.1 DUF1838 family protein [Cytophagales bacterium]